LRAIILAGQTTLSFLPKNENNIFSFDHQEENNSIVYSETVFFKNIFGKKSKKLELLVWPQISSFLLAVF
jgi:hypothetical protein